MSQNNRQIIVKAIAALADELKPQLVEVINDLIESERITEVLIDLGIIADEDQGEILAEGLFNGFSLAMDEAFSINEEDEDDEPVSGIDFPCCNKKSNK